MSTPAARVCAGSGRARRGAGSPQGRGAGRAGRRRPPTLSYPGRRQGGFGNRGVRAGEQGGGRTWPSGRSGRCPPRPLSFGGGPSVWATDLGPTRVTAEERSQRHCERNRAWFRGPLVPFAEHGAGPLCPVHSPGGAWSLIGGGSLYRNQHTIFLQLSDFVNLDYTDRCKVF